MSTSHRDFKIRTAHNKIDAVFENGQLLLQDEFDSLHSVIDVENPHHLLMENLQMMMLSLLFHPQPQKILLLGIAGGSLIHFLRYHYPRAIIDAVDIDAEMVELLSESGWLPSADDQLNYHLLDAFEFLRETEKSYDLVLLDLFINTVTPAQLLDSGVQKKIESSLTAPGIVACNLLFNEDRDYRSIYNLWQELYDDQVLKLVPDELENQLLLGFKGRYAQNSMADLLQRAQQLSESHGFDHCANLGALYAANPVDGGIL